jgi:ABC-type multidrug transport system fused ATPase/permease subunit
LKLHGVSFAYPESNRLAVKNINIEIFKGECIALVGPSGGGKSTITDLITGLLVPQEGEVRIDGENLRTLEVNVWRQQIGIVMQDSLILHSSISENVAFGESDEVDREQVIVALKQAHAWEFVSKLPEGIDTVVAERGARLSGGQRQRIAIARALYRKPDLLILDEATSALDGFAEEKVQQAIEEMRGTISIVLVAHRLNTVKMADRIIVMNNGEISESGKWGDLIASRGFFSEMAKLQGAPIKSADR